MTMYPICSVMLSYDSTRAITVTKATEKEYYVKMYDLETNELTFEEKIGGKSDCYIKLKDVEQSSKGDKYGIAYFDDGMFKFRNFGKTTRTEQEIESNELDINKLLGLDNWTMAIQGFPDPYVTCCFITDEKVFINLFYNPTLTHYHFIWDVTKKSIIGKPVQLKMECSKKNFPYKCFYNEDKHEIYSFYR